MKSTGTRAVAVTLLLAAVMMPIEAQTFSERRWSSHLPLSEPLLHPRAVGTPSVAFTGTVYLVVWAQVNGVVAVRLDRDGRLLDSVPFLLVESPACCPFESPKVAWNGAKFLVAWRSDPATVSAMFVREDTSRTDIFNVLTNDYDPGLNLATDGNTFLVAGTTRSERIALIGPDGAVQQLMLPARGLTIGSVASNGYGYVVAARDNTYPHWTRAYHVSTAGRVIETIVTNLAAPLIFRHRHVYFMLGTRDGVVAHMVDGDARLTGVRIPIATNHEQRNVYASAVNSDEETILLWSRDDATNDGGTLMRSTINGEGGVETVAMERHARAIAAAGRVFVWAEADGVHHMHADRGLVEGTSFGARDQSRPSVVATNEGWFASWLEVHSSQRSTIKGAVVAPQLARAEVVVSVEESSNGSPVVASNGEVVLVAWVGDAVTAAGNIYFRRFTRSAAPLDPHPVRAHRPLRTTGSMIAGWTGRHFLIAYSEGNEFASIRTIRIDANGIILDLEPKVLARSLRPFAKISSLDFARDGETSVLVWQDGDLSICPPDCPSAPLARVEAIRLSSEGDALDVQQTIVTKRYFSQTPAVAALDGRFFVVWREGYGISGRVMRTDDLTSGTERVIAQPRIDSSTALSATATTRDFVVAWEDYWSVRGARVDLAGRTSEMLTIVDDVPMYGQLPLPSMAARGEDLLVVYPRFRHEDGGAVRAYMRALYEPVARMRGVGR